MPHDPRSDNTNSNSILKNLDDRKTQLSRHAMLEILVPQDSKIQFSRNLEIICVRQSVFVDIGFPRKPEGPSVQNSVMLANLIIRISETAVIKTSAFLDPPGSRYPTIRLSRIPKIMAARIHGNPVFQTYDFIGFKSICQ